MKLSSRNFQYIILADPIRVDADINRIVKNNICETLKIDGQTTDCFNNEKGAFPPVESTRSI